MHEPPRFGDRRRLRIGLLGGSFNPAHAGHRLIAAQCLRALGLDQVWLLVSPGNPLKPRAGMAPLTARLASARAIADGRRIIATAIEARLGTSFTRDTIAALRRRFPRARFVWLMGADILEELPRWWRWREIARLLPFAVHPRPEYNARARASGAAHALRAARKPPRAASALALAQPPAWVFLQAAQNPVSASALRRAADRVSSLRSQPPRSQHGEFPSQAPPPPLAASPAPRRAKPQPSPKANPRKPARRPSPRDSALPARAAPPPISTG